MTLQAAGDRAGRLSQVLIRLRRALRRRTRAALGIDPLPQAQVELMGVLSREPDLTVGELARRLQLAVNTVSALAARMVEAGLLERSVDAADRRLVRLRLTTTARRRMQRWRDQRAVELTAALDSLDGSDRALVEGALEALERLADQLEG